MPNDELTKALEGLRRLNTTIKMNSMRSRAARLEREAKQLRLEIEQLERESHVGVQFHGNSTIYTYEIAPGHSAEVGDYVCVYSPYTEQDELVRVVRLGRGDWTGRCKIAYAIDWCTRT